MPRRMWTRAEPRRHGFRQLDQGDCRRTVPRRLRQGSPCQRSPVLDRPAGQGGLPRIEAPWRDQFEDGDETPAASRKRVDLGLSFEEQFIRKPAPVIAQVRKDGHGGRPPASCGVGTPTCRTGLVPRARSNVISRSAQDSAQLGESCKRLGLLFSDFGQTCLDAIHNGGLFRGHAIRQQVDCLARVGGQVI